MKNLAFASYLFFISVQVYAAQSELPKFDEELAEVGITMAYNSDSLDILIEALRTEISLLDKQDKKDALNGALENSVSKFTEKSSEGVQDSTYRSLLSLLYSLRADRLGEQSGKKIKNGLKMLGHIMGSRSLPYVAPNMRTREAPEVELEAYNLMDPSTGRIYAHPSELKGMTVNQIASLDVAPDNSLWYTEAELRDIKKEYGSNWNYLEKRIQDGVSKAIGRPYNIDTARRILIFDGVRSGGTSAKADVKDLYGQKWKIKLGEETQTEPIVNRLYTELGGKYADLVYANSGGEDDLILILQDPAGEGASDPNNCDVIPSAEKLKACFLASEFNADISAFIVAEKTVTEDTLAKSSVDLEQDQKQNLIGRRYLVLSESGLEFKPPASVATTLGAVPFSNARAIEDRAKRGLVVFSDWIANKDAKDDNNKGVAIDGEYIEYMHDLGAALGDLKHSGLVNALEPDYLELKKDKIKIDVKVLYTPDSFELATFADATWMARKILSLSVDEIRDIVKETKWPQFQQDVMTDRLIHRRNNISHIYGDGSKLPAILTQPVVVNLSSRQDRLNAAQEFNLALTTQGDLDRAADLIEAKMRAAGIAIDSNGNANFNDTVATIEEGVSFTAECGNSVIISVLEETVRPTGLARRVPREKDDVPLKQCTPRL